MTVTPHGQLQALAAGSVNIISRFAGMVGIGPVSVYSDNPLPPNHLAITTAGGTGVNIQYHGLAGQTYKLLRAPTVLGPWDLLDTRVAPGSGMLDFADPTPLTPNSFYRVQGP